MKKTTIKHFWGLLCLLLGYLPVFPFQTACADGGSATTVLNFDDPASVKLDGYIELLEDSGGKLGIGDITSHVYRNKFSRPGQFPLNIGFSTSAWWARVTLENESDRRQTLFLRQHYPLIDNIEFWETDAKGIWRVFRTGDKQPFAQRHIEHRDFLFPIVMPAESRAVKYFRFETQGSLDIKLSLYSPLALVNALSTEQLVCGIYYGGFLVLVIYNLFIFIAVRDRVFLYYLLYVVSYGLYMSVHNGLAFQFLWPDSPHWGNQSLLVLLALSLMWAVQFSRKILAIDTCSPRLDRLSILILYVLAINLVAAFICPYAVMIVSLSIVTVTVMPLIFVMGLERLFGGYATARYFMLAWSALIGGVMVYMAKIFGMLPHTFLTENGFQIGSMVEMVLLSLALGNRVNELKQESRTDALTALANRREFDQLLSQAFSRATRYRQPLSLLMIDIDYFKQFNDRFGHVKGDEVLKQVGNLLDKSVRKPNLPCRFGGEEFAVILPRTDVRSAEIIAERLRRKVEELSQGCHPITISVGLACACDGSVLTVEDLLDCADRALYYAKERGRNRVVNITELEMGANAVAG